MGMLRVVNLRLGLENAVVHMCVAAFLISLGDPPVKKLGQIRYQSCTSHNVIDECAIKNNWDPMVLIPYFQWSAYIENTLPKESDSRDFGP